MSRSLGGGLERWEFVGSTESGENVCVLLDEAAVCSETRTTQIFQGNQDCFGA